MEAEKKKLAVNTAIDDPEIELVPPTRTRQVIVTFKLPEDMVRKLNECTRKLGLAHRSELIRMALKLFMEVQGCG